MQTRFRIHLLVAVSILLLASCKKNNKEGRYVPKDAAIAVHINGASLSTKLPWDEVKQNPLFQEMYADSTVPPFVKNALNNPDNSGIDVKTDLSFFAQKDSAGGIIGFTGTVKDAEKFRLFFLDASEGGSENEKDGIKFISKSPMCVGWNKERFLLIVNAPQLDMHAYMDKQTRDLFNTCKELFDIKESNSLGENEKFTKMVKKTGDIHFWMNSEELYKSGMNNPALAMLKLDNLYKGSITAAAINFENGKILMDAKSYAGKELTELYKKYGGKNIDEDMIKHLPVKDVAAVFAMSFKPEGIKEFLKLLGVEGYANMGLAFAGFGLDDFIKANKGDIVFALTDLKQKANTDTANSMGTNNDGIVEPDVIFAASIGDKDAFNLLIKAGEKLGGNLPASIPVSYKSDGKYFAIGNVKENTDNYIAGKANNNFDFLSKISGNPVGGYVNFQFILKAIESNLTKDSSAKIVYDASVKMWDNLYMKGGQFEDGGITQSLEVNLMDKNTNSLKQLNQYVGLLGKLKMERDKKRQMNDVTIEEIKPDSISVAVPPPPVKKHK
ncbi:DUF4836 family protein [Ferruginibacter profundus]